VTLGVEGLLSLGEEGATPLRNRKMYKLNMMKIFDSLEERICTKMGYCLFWNPDQSMVVRFP
jgi:hypothetical protein